MSAFPQMAYVAGVDPDGNYLVAVPLLTLEATVPLDRVYLTEQVVTLVDGVIQTTTRVPALQVGQEVVVVFCDGNEQVAAIIAARPVEG